MALNVITWLWGDKYGVRDVVRLSDAVAANLKREHKFYLFTNRDINAGALPAAVRYRQITDPKLCERNCFCRLRMFDPLWQVWHGMKAEEQIVSLDLDIVIVGSLDQVFDRPETFIILQGANASNPCPYNASVMMLCAGHHGKVWTEFSVDKAQTIPFYEFPDDQGWIAHMLPDAPGWKVGSPSGIYAFQKPGWPQSDELPNDAKIVTFIGKRKPHMYAELPWMQKHWAAGLIRPRSRCSSRRD